MSFLEQLRKDKMQSMRDKDKLRTGVISLMMSNIALAEKEEKKELTDEEALEFVQKELKQTRDTLDSIPEGRDEMREETLKKIEIISSYLPEQLTEEEVEKALKEIMEEKNISPEPKSRGILIKEMLSRYQGQTDGKTVNQVVGKVLK